MHQHPEPRRKRPGACPAVVPACLVFLLSTMPAGVPAAPMPRLFPPASPPAAVLDVVDVHGEKDDLKLAATTLQGLVNRGDETTVFLFLFDPQGSTSPFWLDLLRRRGYTRDTRRLSLAEYFDKYLGQAKGLVVYDPDLPVTLNIATMIAAVESRMVVGPGEVERFGKRLPDVKDLRGRWDTNLEAYEWAFNTLWPKLRHDILAVYHPTHARHHLRDYLVRNRIFTLWVTGKGHDREARADHGAERQFAERVLAATPPNIPIIGWWDGGSLDTGMTEYGGVGLAGEYGKITVGNNWQSNLSLYAGVPVDVDRLMTRFRARKENTGPATAEPEKVYISYVFMESGDSPAYWQHVQKRVWDDAGRGTLPIGWTITPTLFELTPTVGEWFLDHATADDHFVMALSGWGYCHPYRDFMGKTPEPEAGWKAYLASTSAWMQFMDMVDLALYTDAWRPFRRNAQDATSRRFVEAVPGLRSLILGMGRDQEITTVSPHYRLGDTVVSHVFTRWDTKNIGRNAENNAWLAKEIRTQTPKTRPAFMFIHPLSWSYYPSDLVAVTEQLGEEYVAVPPGTLTTFIANSLR